MGTTNEGKRNARLWTLGLASVLGLGIVAPAAVAGDGGVQAKLDEIKELIIGLAARMQSDHGAQDTQLVAIGDEVVNIEDKLDVLQVDAIGNEANADPGEDSADPFNNANILIRVSFKGEGIADLTEANVQLTTRLVPPGTCALEVDEFNFFGPPAGDYALSVTPVDHPTGSPEQTTVCDWAAGEYGSSIVVTWNGMSGSTLVEFEVH